MFRCSFESHDTYKVVSNHSRVHNQVPCPRPGPIAWSGHAQCLRGHLRREHSGANPKDSKAQTSVQEAAASIKPQNIPEIIKTKKKKRKKRNMDRFMEMKYYCKHSNCITHRCKKRCNLVKHIRSVHLRQPVTRWKQMALGIQPRPDLERLYVGKL